MGKETRRCKEEEEGECAGVERKERGRGRGEMKLVPTLCQKLAMSTMTFQTAKTMPIIAEERGSQAEASEDRLLAVQTTGVGTVCGCVCVRAVYPIGWGWWVTARWMITRRRSDTETQLPVGRPVMVSRGAPEGGNMIMTAIDREMRIGCFRLLEKGRKLPSRGMVVGGPGAFPPLNLEVGDGKLEWTLWVVVHTSLSYLII